MKRIGIDVGGTNTDAVLLGDGQVLGAVKSPTTGDVTTGIVAATRKLRSEVDLTGLEAVLVGTTHFVNAVVQRRSLSKVAAIRIGLPATASLPPFTDWPAELAALATGGVWMVEGGHDYDGRRFVPLAIADIRRIARDIAARGLKQVAVASMFSPLNSSDETTAADILRDEIPDVSVTCSHMLGGIGLLERENATLLNAALVELAQTTVRGFERAMREIGIVAPLYITQNDGTVAEASRAVLFPVYSFASGPTNSMRGAAFLSRIQEAIVTDVGGTTSDFGHLRLGFPRESNSVVHVGGVRTLFRMPDLVSIGLGGSSIVDPNAHMVGPLSVGFLLTEKALVFGGDQLTATDIGVAAGLLELGDRSKVRHLSPGLIKGVLEHVKATIEECVDRVKADAGDVTLIAVGGGDFLVPDDLQGVKKLIRLEHGGCANAIGAAIAQVSGEVDQVFQGVSRTDAIRIAQDLANRRAVDAGAEVDSLMMVEAEDIPIAYLPGNALRIRVKVVGDIKAGTAAGMTPNPSGGS
jgi:N-methylhydantoinase A/oxoprolinase/acetone carboxylase beta subunit